MFNFVLKYLVNRNIKRDERKPAMLFGNSIERVIVLSNYSSEGFQAVTQYVRELRERGIKHVDFLIEFDSKKSMEANSSNLKGVAFCSKDIGVFGSIKNPDLQSCLNNAYEIVLDLTDGTCVHSDYILTSLNATWRVGLKRRGRSKFLDLIIDGDSKQLKNSIEHLNSYLFNLNNLSAA